jgi:hypothetical protein
MRKINFREEMFRGTLAELLEQGKPETPDLGQTFSLAHTWLRRQLTQRSNIFPVRKSSKYPLRGSLHQAGFAESLFMPTDNEPLADLYQRWLRGDMLDSAIGAALVEGKIVASWRCDQLPLPVPSMLFKGVKTSFRDRGLKLAHITDTARGFSSDMTLPEQITIRFFRSLSPFNVFLFPSGRCCEFRLISSRAGWQPRLADWAEDLEIRKIALGWLVDWQGTAALDALPDFRSELRPGLNWLQVAHQTEIEVHPKNRSRVEPETKLSRRQTAKPFGRLAEPSSRTCPKVPRDKALTVGEAVEVLRAWRSEHALATRLDGRKSGSNPSPWLHIRVDGYDDNEPFASRYGPIFGGRDYNGVVNFHGDTTISAIDRFIGVIDVAEDYRDVLRPSATYEITTKPMKRVVRPKFALQGYQDKVEGFFLYHDEWKKS